MVLTDQEMIDELQQLAEDLGHVPTSTEIEKHASFSRTAMYDHFGSLGEFRERAGLDPAPHQPAEAATDEELLDALREASDELGRVVRITDTSSDELPYSRTPYEDRWGTFSAARAAAGLPRAPHRPGREASDEDLLDELRRLASVLGREPSQGDIKEHSDYSVFLFVDRFGGVTTARKEAGVGDGEMAMQPDYSDQELLDHLYELGRDLHGLPTEDTINNADGPSLGTYLNRFDSLDAAREAAGLDRLDYHARNPVHKPHTAMANSDVEASEKPEDSRIDRPALTGRSKSRGTKYREMQCVAMVNPKIKAASGLIRREGIPDSDRTPARDELADWIESQVIDGDLDWADTTMTDIAERFGCSREHVSNTLDAYFVPEERVELPDVLMESPDEGNTDDYKEGYRQGLLDGIRLVLEEAEEGSEEEATGTDALRKLI